MPLHTGVCEGGEICQKEGHAQKLNEVHVELIGHEAAPGNGTVVGSKAWYDIVTRTNKRGLADHQEITHIQKVRAGREKTD